MNTTVNIRFGKKDAQLIEWWDEMAKRECNISRTIYLATLYYIRTGEYLTIAKMKKSNPAESAVLKKFYLQENTEVYNWLAEKQEQKMVVSQIIRGILKQSIEITQGENSFVEMDKLVLLVEQAQPKDSNSRPAAGKTKDINREEPSYKQLHRNESRTESYKPNPGTEEKKEGYHAPNYEEENSSGPDIFDILSGGHRLEL